MSKETAEPSIVNAWSTKSSVPFFRVGNYAPVFDELTTFDLPVDGVIPPDLNSWYLRNGPNPRHDTSHWFTGDAMVHGVRLESGRAAWYRNRWVRTESFEKPFLLYNKDGTRNLHASVSNTNVVNHAGKTLALVESSLPYEITNELETLGAYDFGGKLADSMNAWDPARIARAWVVLMKRLGYTRYVAQGGDWGYAVTEQMALLAPPELLRIHTNMPATIPDDIAKALHLPRTGAQESQLTPV